jgi:hypothetical protein
MTVVAKQEADVEREGRRLQREELSGGQHTESTPASQRDWYGDEEAADVVEEIVGSLPELFSVHKEIVHKVAGDRSTEILKA